MLIVSRDDFRFLFGAGSSVDELPTTVCLGWLSDVDVICDSSLVGSNWPSSLISGKSSVSRRSPSTSCSSSSKSRILEFSQELPLQLMQTSEHWSPIFRHQHDFAQQQKIEFKTFEGAGPRVDRIGESLGFLCQPHLSAGGVLPSHDCTWWYTRKECIFAASSVGGRDASWFFSLPTIFFLKQMNLNSFKD